MGEHLYRMIKTHYTILTLCFLFLGSSAAFAQKTYVTKSGQAITIFSNGKWEYTDIDATTEDGSLFSSSDFDVNPFEEPTDKKYILTDEEARIVNDLRNDFLYHEADFFVRYMIIQVRNDEGKPSKEAKKLEDELEDKYKLAANQLDRLKKIEEKDLDKRQETILKVRKVLNKDFNPQQEETTTDEPFKFKPLQNTASVVLPEFEVDNRYPYEVEGNGCEIIYNDFDKSLNKKRKETKHSTWFTYTHPKLYNYFKEKDFITAESSMMKVDGKTYLNLRMILATKDAKRSYGHVEEGALLRVTLINGTRLFLRNNIRSEGKIEAYTGNTIFQMLYHIDGDKRKELAGTEVDKVGIMWTTGFEEYDVYEVDFITKHLDCLAHGK